MEYVIPIIKQKLYRDADAVDDLKHKVIKQFLETLCQLSKGKKIEYKSILDKINLIELIEDEHLTINDALFIIQYYLNEK